LVFFGVLMTVNLCIGMITPPVGVNLYVAQGVCKAPFDQVIKESIPLLGIRPAMIKYPPHRALAGAFAYLWQMSKQMVTAIIGWISGGDWDFL
uniref:TRAP transporter large permease subunit n=1 Tax=Acetomicrobium sp. S15 = DSM 107314 TaxID=2529858 RepID=UPI0018E17AA9